MFCDPVDNEDVGLSGGSPMKHHGHVVNYIITTKILYVPMGRVSSTSSSSSPT